MLNQLKNFAIRRGYAEMVQRQYDNPRNLFTNELSSYIYMVVRSISSIHIKLETMPDNKTAVFDNWYISTSYAPFLSSPTSHDFPRYLKEKRELPYDFNFVLNKTIPCSGNGFVMVIKTARGNQFRNDFTKFFSNPTAPPIRH